MAKESVVSDQEILEAALVAYQSQLTRIDEAIGGIRSRLGIRGPRRLAMTTDGIQPTPTKLKMSAAASSPWQKSDFSEDSLETERLK
jgi:hypothetical protein